MALGATPSAFVSSTTLRLTSPFLYAPAQLRPGGVLFEQPATFQELADEGTIEEASLRALKSVLYKLGAATLATKNYSKEFFGKLISYLAEPEKHSTLLIRLKGGCAARVSIVQRVQSRSIRVVRSVLPERGIIASPSLTTSLLFGTCG